ncbi:hypothetical protein Tco_0813326 [Tanacetum coccineum]
MAGSDNDSDDASVHSEASIPQQQRNNQPQYITTVSNNNAKFPYLKKDEYEVWAMKMEYWITNNDMNIWKVIQNGNSLKRTGRDCDGRVIILPSTTADEHIAVQRKSKARTTLLQSILDDHVADFHYMDDARDIWNAVKARFGGNAKSKKMRKSMLKQEFSEFRISEAEGLHKGYDRMQKILSQLNQLKAKPEDEDINLKFLRALPSSWSQVALTLKTKGGLKFLSFDDLYYKSNHSAFVSTTSASKKMSYADSPSYSSSTYTAPLNSKTGSHRSGNVIKDVLHSFVADTEPEQQPAYKDFKQIEKIDLEKMDLKWQMAMLSVRRGTQFGAKASRKMILIEGYARFTRRRSDVSKCLQRGHFARECRANGGNDKHRYSSFKIQEIGKKEEDSKALITIDTLVDWIEHDECVAKIYNLITRADTKEASIACDAGEFDLMGVTSEKNHLTLEDKIRVLSIELENTTNLLKHFERINAIAETAKKELQKKLDNHLVESEKWDDSTFSVFTTNSEEVEGRPLFNRFAKADSMKAVPPPLSGDYTPLSDHIDLDESQMSYGTKSSTSGDSNSCVYDFCLLYRSYSNAEDEWIFDSGCSRSMTSNMERLDDFQEFQGSKVTFGGGKGSISEPFVIASFGPSLVLLQLEGIDHKSYCLVIMMPLAENTVEQTRNTWKLQLNPQEAYKAKRFRLNRATPLIQKMLEESFRSRVSTKCSSCPTRLHSLMMSLNMIQPSPSDLGNNEPSPSIFSSSSYDDEFGADLNNLASTVEVIRLVLCKRRSKVEPRSVAQALEDPSWVDAMQEEMQQFKFQNVWVLVDFPKGKYAIGTKWILKNKRDTMGIVVRNKARLMDVKSAFLYGRIDEEIKPGVLSSYQRPDGFFIGQDKRLISWQFKKQTIVATSSIEVEYVVAANCCGQSVAVSDFLEGSAMLLLFDVQVPTRLWKTANYMVCKNET